MQEPIFALWRLYYFSQECNGLDSPIEEFSFLWKGSKELDW